jgi:RNase adapter protein RapZ
MMKVLIISGISGSGKSTFLRALEDTGYYCVDNFPLILLIKFLDLCNLADGKIQKCAFVVDIREREFFAEGKDILIKVKEEYRADLIFLESSEETLIKRFKETRRSHPLYDTSSVKDALQQERALVDWIRRIAGKVIDTSQFNPHELRRFVLENFGEDEKKMKISLMSFGYAYGIPLEADMVLDARFLPNPFFVESLKDKNGLSCEVRDYITSHEMYSKYFDQLLDLFTFLIPLFEKEGKSYLTICIGCTGGKHRSVVIANELKERLAVVNDNIGLSVIHRDVDR